MPKQIGRPPPTYVVTGVPGRMSLEGRAPMFTCGGDEPIPQRLSTGEMELTTRQIADASGLRLETIRRRIVEQGIRDWPTLTRSAEAGRAAGTAKAKAWMTAEQKARRQDREREMDRQARIRAGHKEIE